MAEYVDESYFSNHNTTTPDASADPDQNESVITPAMSFLYVFIPSVGIPGNIFAAFVMLSSADMRQKPCNLFMIHQSIIDLLACVFTLIGEFYGKVSLGKDPSLKENLFCYIFLSSGVMWSFIHLSGYNLMFLTLERYWAIKKPLQYSSNSVKRRLPYVFIAAWLIGFASLFPNFTTSRIVDGKCRAQYDIKSAVILNLMTPYFFSVSCGIPGTVMLYAYISIGLSLKRSQKFQTKGDQTKANTKLKKAQMNLLQTCVSLMILFFLCWIQLTVVFFLYAINYFTVLFNNKYYHISLLCIILNSCLNPYIYSARYNEFQVQIKYLYSKINLFSSCK